MTYYNNGIETTITAAGGIVTTTTNGETITGAGPDNYNIIFAALAESLRLADAVNAEIETYRAALRDYMRETGTEVLTGSEHRATLKAITTARIDGAALKRELPEIAARYTKSTTAERFNFT